MSKYTTIIKFENKYHRDLFEDWMSNLGEQEFNRQLDVEKENETDIPKRLIKTGIVFKYPKKGFIITEVYEDET